MRKITSISLLIVFCNSFFYYTYFSFSIIKAKFEASVTISNPGIEKIYFKIRTAALQKDEADEAWYNNKLYDVAERESINDTEYVYLVRDDQEQDVLIQNSEYFRNDLGIFLGSGYILSPQKKSQSITDNNYITASSKKIFWRSYLLCDPGIQYKFKLASFPAEVPTPPPRLA